MQARFPSAWDPKAPGVSVIATLRNESGEVMVAIRNRHDNISEIVVNGKTVQAPKPEDMAKIAPMPPLPGRTQSHDHGPVVDAGEFHRRRPGGLHASGRGDETWEWPKRGSTAEIGA